MGESLDERSSEDRRAGTPTNNQSTNEGRNEDRLIIERKECRRNIMILSDKSAFIFPAPEFRLKGLLGLGVDLALLITLEWGDVIGDLTLLESLIALIHSIFSCSLSANRTFSLPLEVTSLKVFLKKFKEG
jgi:hypothetical protein